MLIAADYSVAMVINEDAIKESEMEGIKAIKKRKKEASFFFSNLENFSNQSNLLFNKAIWFLQNDNSLGKCLICKASMPLLKTFSWACAKEKTTDGIFRSIMDDSSPYYRMMDGMGSVACCGKQMCNWGMLCMFKERLIEHHKTMEMTRERPEIVFECDFCLRRTTVHRSSGCKSC